MSDISTTAAFADTLREAHETYRHLVEGIPAVLYALTIEPPRETQTIQFRIAQEAIANARKHAGADRIEVSIAEEDGGVRLVVADDGGGFDTGVVVVPEPGHIGLSTMVERAELAGGRCEIESDPGHGTSVRAWLPLSSPA